MPARVRRAPLSERVKAFLNPYDFLLWLSEELHESAWDEALRDYTTPIGVAANILFIIARANSGGEKRRSDDVFGDFDGRGGSGWFAWFASFISHFLVIITVLNAAYTFTRTRKYRLFESNIDKAPSTPSAHRVKVEDSPSSSSPMRLFSSILNATSAAARAHPDERQDVWELRVWDPKQLNLELFTFFSPGHVLIYWLFLPTASTDPRPSVTVFTSLLLGALFTAQLVLLRIFFVQQAKDTMVVHKEVMNEYDTKFVHPSMNKPVRDVGIQTRESAKSPGKSTREVDVYTPTTVINRGFKVNPNPNYAGHLGDDAASVYENTPTRRLPRSGTTLALKTPFNSVPNGYANFAAQTDKSVALESPSPLKARERSPIKGDGGSLGVYSHAASPLRKSTSSGFLRPATADAARGRSGSPLKRMSLGPTPGLGPGTGTGSEALNQRFAGLRDHRRETGRF